MRSHRDRATTTKRRIALILIVVLSVESVSCGTLIHPERNGQPHTTRLDPAVVLLDGLGVLVFLVPGVVAFVVDFSTGAIYLPESQVNAYPASTSSARRSFAATAASFSGSPRPLMRIDTGAATLTKDQIEAIVRARTGQDIKLDAPEVRVIRANNLDDASAAVERSTVQSANVQRADGASAP